MMLPFMVSGSERKSISSRLSTGFLLFGHRQPSADAKII